MRRVIWAVDPFLEDQRFHCSAAWVLHDLARSDLFEIEPVYLYGGRAMNTAWAERGQIPVDLQTKSEEGLENTLRRIRIRGIQRLRLLNAPYRNLREAADRLLDYARDRGAELIVATTHARGGLSRRFLGSFCETLVHRSEIPTLIVNPKRSKPFDFHRIVFATDFSEQSLEAYKRLLRSAKELGSKVRIFHKLGYCLTPELESTFLFPFPQDSLNREIAECLKDGDSWKRIAKEQGVEAELVIDRTLTGNAASAILNEAETERAIIAMAAQSGPIAGTILGSTTLRVLRDAGVPVWVFHSENKRALLSVTEEDVAADLIHHGRKTG